MMQVGDLCKVRRARVHVHHFDDPDMNYYEKFDLNNDEIFVVLEIRMTNRKTIATLILCTRGLGWVPSWITCNDYLETLCEA